MREEEEANAKHAAKDPFAEISDEELKEDIRLQQESAGRDSGSAATQE